MGRTFRAPRTGKRSKANKKARKGKSAEQEAPPTDEVEKCPPSSEGGEEEGAGEPSVSGEMDLGDAVGVTKADDERQESDGGIEGDEGEKEAELEEKGEEPSDDDDEEEEESDEGPEDISLSKGKSDAVERQKDESEQVQRVKDNAKKKRKQKYELFKKQKDAKQVRKLTKFPQEGLEIVAKAMAEQKAAQKTEKKRKKRQKAVQESREAEPADTELEVGGMKVIPLGEENSGAKEMLLRTAAGYEAASEFLTQSLYGDRHKRIPALTLQAKRYRNQPAKNFLKSPVQSQNL